MHAAPVTLTAVACRKQEVARGRGVWYAVANSGWHFIKSLRQKVCTVQTAALQLYKSSWCCKLKFSLTYALTKLLAACSGSRQLGWRSQHCICAQWNYCSCEEFPWTNFKRNFFHCRFNFIMRLRVTQAVFEDSCASLVSFKLTYPLLAMCNGVKI